TELDAALQPLADSDCQVLAAGAAPANPSELLMDSTFVDVLTRLRSACDYVVISAPPVLAVTDAAVIAAADVITLLVTPAGRSTRDDIEEAIKRLAYSGNAPAGVVFNGLKPEHPGYVSSVGV